MTLKTRNQIFRFFSYFSIFFLIISAAAFIYVVAKGIFIAPPNFRLPEFLNKIPFAKQSIAATILSFLFLGAYVPVMLFFIFRYFENTQSLEIIYFSAFLLGIICETARFFTICFGVWQTFTNLLIFLGNIVLFGRIIAPFSFVCAAILSDIEQQQDIERNYMLMTVLAFIFALVIPLNTAQISSTGLVVESSMRILNCTRFILVILAAFSFLVKSIRQLNKDYISLGGWVLLLYSGYALLISSDCYLFCILGTGMLYTGSFFYLKTLHKMYMWL